MKSAFFIILLLTSISINSQGDWYVKDQPIELGQIHWLRDYDKAISVSKDKGLPIVILFQEVPGCSTCTTYGNEILTHPFIVELVETHFVPLAIFNNKGGDDRKILKKYKEPSWNNPVVRIVNHNEKDLVNRLAGDYSMLGLAKNIREALVLSGQTNPRYLDILIEELEGNKHQEEAYLSMYCFWTGEKEIAQLDGVLATEAGFMHGREVVKVTYDKSRTSLKSLSKKAKEVRCADQVYADDEKSSIVDKGLGKYRRDREVKYYLSRSTFKGIPMTSLQAALVNSALGEGKEVKPLLSPRQLDLLGATKNSKIGEDFVTSWYQLVQS